MEEEVVMEGEVAMEAVVMEGLAEAAVTVEVMVMAVVSVLEELLAC